MNIFAIVEKIVTAVVHDHGIGFNAVTQDSKFGDIGMDEIDVIEVVHRAEDSFHVGIPDDAITEDSRVSNLSDLIVDLVEEKAAREARTPTVKKSWLDFPEDAA